MNVLIIEDEEQAGTRLERQLRKLNSDAFIHGPIETVRDAIDWLQQNPTPDLIFLDIHLADGLSFEIFDKVNTSAPVIFTTAYDQYALRAFKMNSIDYLLKPVEEKELTAALNKFKKSFIHSPLNTMGMGWQSALSNEIKTAYKQRFITRIGDRLTATDTADVAFVFSENKGTYLRTTDCKSHLVDFSLEQIESMLDPNEFFRLNRKYMVRFEAVEKMLGYSNSRLKILLKNWDDQDIVLSREKTREFKSWLDR